MMEGQKLSPQTGTSRFKIKFIFFWKYMLKCSKGSFCYKDLQFKMKFSWIHTICHMNHTVRSSHWTWSWVPRSDGFSCMKTQATHVIWTQDVSSLITRGFPFKNSMQMRSQHCEIWDRKGCSRNRVTRFSRRCFGKKGQIYFHLWSIIK